MSCVRCFSKHSCALRAPSPSSAQSSAALARMSQASQDDVPLNQRAAVKAESAPAVKAESKESAESAKATASFNITSCVLVTGDTFGVKNQLKELGGEWCKPLKGWVLPEERRAAVLSALGGDASVASSSSLPATPAVQPSVGANASLTFSKQA